MTIERLHLARRHAALLKAIDRYFATPTTRAYMPSCREDLLSMYAQIREEMAMRETHHPEPAGRPAGA